MSSLPSEQAPDNANPDYEGTGFEAPVTSPGSDELFFRRVANAPIQEDFSDEEEENAPSAVQPEHGPAAEAHEKQELARLKAESLRLQVENHFLIYDISNRIEEKAARERIAERHRLLNSKLMSMRDMFIEGDNQCVTMDKDWVPDPRYMVAPLPLPTWQEEADTMERTISGSCVTQKANSNSHDDANSHEEDDVDHSAQDKYQVPRAPILALTSTISRFILSHPLFSTRMKTAAREEMEAVDRAMDDEAKSLRNLANETLVLAKELDTFVRNYSRKDE